MVTTATLSVNVTANGARTAGNDLSHLARQSSKAEQAVAAVETQLNRMQKLLAIGGLASLGKQVLDAADKMQSLHSQLKQVTSGMTDYTHAEKALFEISQRTTASLEATTQTFVSTKRALAEMGVTTNQTLKFTETLNKAMAVGGVNAESQKSALLQLSQALGSGVLQGDEFRSIAENAPIILDMVAEYMGKSRAEIKKLASDGKITSKVLFEAISGASGKISAKFDEMPMTFGQAMQQMENAWLKFVDGLNSSGVMSALAQSVSFLAQHFDVLAKAVGYTTVAYVTWVATQKLGTLTQGVGALDLLCKGYLGLTSAIRGATVAMMTNPLGLLAVAITAAAFAFDAFLSDMTFGASEIGTTWGDVATGVWQDFTSLMSNAAKAVISYWDDATKQTSGFWESALSAVISADHLIVEAWQQSTNAIIGLFVAGYNAISIIWGDLPNAFSAIGKSAINSLISIIERGLNYLAQGLSSFLSLFNSASNAVGLGDLFDTSAMQVKLPKLELTEAQNQIKSDLSQAMSDAFSRDYVGETIGGVTGYLQSAGDRVRKEKQKNGDYQEGEWAGLKNTPSLDKKGKGNKKAKKEKSSEDYRNDWDKYYDDLVNANATAWEKIKYEQDVAMRELEKHLSHGVVTQEEAEKARTLIGQQYAKQRSELAGQYAPEIAYQNKLKEQLQDIQQLEKGGALTTEQAARARQNLGAKYSPLIAAMEEYHQKLAEIEALEKARILTTEQANIARTDAEYEKWKGTADKADPMNGIRQGWEEWAKTAGNTMEQVANITTQALDGMADQLTNFVMTGKADFRSLTVSILSDISKMIIKMMILNAVKAAFGGFSGGGLVGGTEVNGNATYGMGTWATGGYTGNGSKYEPAGIVHKGEYVITKEATARLGRGFLDQLNYGGSTGYATGGLVGDSSTVPTLPNNAQASQNNTITITVNVDQNGNTHSQTEGQTSEKEARQLGKTIEAKVLEVLVKQKRNGNLLA
ncbi:phage tail tape measure protein [uncultured Haemophilus sp.]|uniref:phage tail tape measure protein n=1 Tax=uncultured Haemophilus sp. TaxID=237779 RepID=UPI002588EBC3|nr:phage tail tape measure protein [uncultured Haemophilus sp.]